MQKDQDDSDNRDVRVPFTPYSFANPRENESASSLPMRPEKEDEARHQTEKTNGQHTIEKSRSSRSSTHDSLAIHIHLNADECFPLSIRTGLCVGPVVRTHQSKNDCSNSDARTKNTTETIMPR